MKTIISLSSSAIKSFLACPMFWNYRHAQGRSLQQGERRLSLDAGTLVHFALENFYRGRGRGETGVEAMAKALRFDDGRIPKDDELSIAQMYKLYPEHHGLLRTRLMQYAGVAAMDPRHFRPVTEDSVELGFSTPIYEDDSHIFVIEGRIDLLVQTAMGLTNVDHKTQWKYSNLDVNKPQFVIYAIGAEAPNLVINYIMLTATYDAKYTFRRDGTTFSKSFLDWYRSMLITQVFGKIAMWNIAKNLGSCSGVYESNPCMFQSVCFDTNDERAEKILRHKYVQIKNRRSW